MSENFDDLLGQYWDMAYSEGMSGVSRGDQANELLFKLRALAASNPDLQAQAGEPPTNPRTGGAEMSNNHDCVQRVNELLKPHNTALMSELSDYYAAQGRQLELAHEAIAKKDATEQQLRKALKACVEALGWYISEDDVAESMEGNEYWVSGKRKAESAITQAQEAMK